MDLCLKNGNSYFVVASVFNDNETVEKLILEGKKAKTLQAPSVTLMFHLAINCIEKVIKSGHYGKNSNIMQCSIRGNIYQMGVI